MAARDTDDTACHHGASPDGTTSATARARADRLRDGNGDFSAGVTAGADLVYRMSADWREMRRLVGGDFVPDTDDPGQTWLDRYVHPDDQSEVTAAIREATCTKRVFEMEHRVRRVDGSLGWTISRAIPILDANGELVEWIGMARDVTARKDAQEALGRAAARDAFRLRLSDALRGVTDALHVQFTAMQLLADHLHTDRAFYYGAVRDETGWVHVVERDFSRSACMVSFVGAHPQATLGAPTLMAGLEKGESLAVRDVRDHPAISATEAQRYLARGIAAYAVAPVVSGGRYVGGICVEQAEPRDWSPEEVALIRDVAERTWEAIGRARSEDELRRREGELRFVLNAAEAGVWSWDVLTYHMEWDDRFRAMLGLEPHDESTLETWLAAVHPEDRAAVVARLNEIQRDPQEVRWNQVFRVVRRGDVVWMHELGRAEHDHEGRVTRMMGITLDITDRRRAEEAIAERREHERTRTLHLLLESATQGIVSVDPAGTIVTANRALEAMFGWSPGELLGQSIEILVPAPLAVRHGQHRTDYFAAPRPRPMGQDLELVGARKDGTTFPIEVSLNHVPTAEGGLAIAFVTDVSERVRAAAALRASHEHLERRTQQLSRLATELTLTEQHARQQLAKTLHDGLQQMLFSARLRIAAVTSTPPRNVSQVAKALDLAIEDLDEAIAAARSLAVELFPPALHERGLPAALTWLAGWMRKKYNLAVRATVDPAADPQRPDIRILLFESIRELLFNIVKHVGTHADASVELAVLDDALCITVADDGPGIDLEKALGHPDAAHTGLGLFSIRERLRLLGGTLEILATAGPGARLRIRAPRAGADHLGQTEGADRADVTGSGHEPQHAAVTRRVTVLVVDDHASVREGLKEMLGGQPGIEVVGEAVNGLDAIAQARALQPDAIVIDVSMPEMDGIEATRRIHAEFPATQIFGFSTQERTEDLHAIEEAGAAGYFTKDADTAHLVARLRAVRRPR
ncbi:MAG: PAS domain S-box protein [Vicinamibacterales bacterium]